MRIMSFLKFDMVKKRNILIIGILSVFFATFVISAALYLKSAMSSVTISCDIPLCSADADLVYADIDIARVKNLLDPVHYEGIITLDGRTYVDRMQRFGVKENCTVFERIGEKFRLKNDSVPYNDFYYPSTGNYESMFWISFINDKKGGTYVRIRFHDMQNDSDAYYYGPAETAKEAAAIEKMFADVSNYDENSGW